MNSHRTRFLLLSALFLAPLWATFLLWIPASVHAPLGRDQGIFAWVGSVVIRGGLPYSDAWDVKGPATHAMYALAILLFGHSEAAIRLFDLLMWVIAGIVFVQIGRTVSNSVVPGLFALPILLSASGGGYWNTAQPDLWAGTFLAAALLMVLSRTVTVRKYAIAGALLGVAALIKPPYALFATIVVAGAGREKDLPLRRSAVSVVAGMATPGVLTAAIYFAHHRFGDLWDVLIRFNLTIHVEQHAFSWETVLDSLSNSLGFAGFSALGLLQILALIGAVVLLRSRRRAGLMLVASLPLALLIVIIQNKFYTYHFLPYWTFVALLAGLGIGRLLSYAVETDRRRVLTCVPALAAVACLLFWLVLPPYSQAQSYWRYATGRQDANTYQLSFCESDFCHSDVSATAAFLKANTKPGDTVYLWGFDALLYFLADRQAPTRFGFNYPLLIDVPEHRARERQELLLDLRRSPPAFFVVERKDANNLMPLSSDQYLRTFPELQLFLAENYTPQISNQHFIVFARSIKPAVAHYNCHSATDPVARVYPASDNN